MNYTIYILLSHSGSLPSKLIRMYTREPYSHVSIALDLDLNELYSFGRLKPSNPILGGFVREDIVYGTFGRFPKTQCAVYSLTVTQQQYHSLRAELNNFVKNSTKYRYNFLGLIGVMFHIPIQRNNRYFCSQFVATLLRNSGIDVFMKDPTLVCPRDFRNCEKLTLIYEGSLSSYRLYSMSYDDILYKA